MSAVVQEMDIERIRRIDEHRRQVEARANELERAATEITDTRFSRWLRDRARAVREECRPREK